MKRVVIIGGGFTGSQCAQKLEKAFDVTLIDDKEYFEFTPSILRTIVKPDHVKKIQVLHTHYLKKTHFVMGSVKNITKKQVILRSGKKIGFDYLVIASGSSYELPIKDHGLVVATRGKELRDYHKRLKKAKSILIVGGGLVGVELAAEICLHCKDKEVIVVNSGDRVISRNHPRAIKYADRFLTKKGVKIVYNARVTSKKGAYFLTDKGTKLKADLCFLCTGIKANYSFMKKYFGKNLSERNQIKVNEHLQLEGVENVFAGGDITAIREEKTAQAAERQANVIATNIQQIENGKGLVSYSNKKRPMLISLGKRDGILDNGNFIITGFFPALLKWYVEWKTLRKYR